MDSSSQQDKESSLSSSTTAVAATVMCAEESGMSNNPQQEQQQPQLKQNQPMSTVALRRPTETTTTTVTMNDSKEMSSRPHPAATANSASSSGSLMLATTADGGQEPTATKRLLRSTAAAAAAHDTLRKPAVVAQVLHKLKIIHDDDKTGEAPCSLSNTPTTTRSAATAATTRSSSSLDGAATSQSTSRVTSSSEGSNTSASACSLDARHHALGDGSPDNTVTTRTAASDSSAATSSSTTTTDDHRQSKSTSAPARAALHSKGGSGSLSTATSSAPPLPPKALPIKSLTMNHLDQKYTAELEYMLREFRKLERQLLGAKGSTSATSTSSSSAGVGNNGSSSNNNSTAASAGNSSSTGVQENAGSRERREKLHSFILHLENTLEQIQLGVQLEAEGKSTVMVGVTVGEVMGNNAASSSSTTLANNMPTKEQVQQQLADSGALASLTREKEEEENVQKLEEHILANLLPVKVRLKKQLAAQQGAVRNPVGMPAARRGMLASVSAEKGATGTFAAAAEQKRKRAAEAAAAAEGMGDSQFGKPIVGGASSLTHKLHGPTLGSSKRKHGHGVGSAEPSTADAHKAPSAKSTTEDSSSSSLPAVGECSQGLEKKRKILYAGMAPGSTQLKSGVSAASGAHKMVIETPSLMPKSSKAQAPEPVQSASVQTCKPAVLPQHLKSSASCQAPPFIHPGQKMAPASAGVAASIAASFKDQKHDEISLTEEQRRKLRKVKKKKKQLKLAKTRERERQMQMIRQKQTAQVSQAHPKPAVGKKGKAAGKNQGKKKGPRSVEYICALCSETYSSTCDCNPWWALAHHDCPKCRKSQVPRVDITAPANAIEYHPALLAHAEEGGNGGGGGPAANGPGAMHINPSHIPSSTTFPLASRRYPTTLSECESGSDLSDISDGDLSDDSIDSIDLDLECMRGQSPAERAENEQFGFEYGGPKLEDDETARLLVLMSHASTCPGRHRHAKHRDVCNNVKYMMLHVRDCPGTTATFDICPFPWCRKVKHMLYHMVSCSRPEDCAICSPKNLSPNLTALLGLNAYRRKKQRERRAAAMAAAAAKSKPPPARAMPKSGKPATVLKVPSRPPQVASVGRTGTTALTARRPVPASDASKIAIASNRKAAATAAAIAAVASGATKPVSLECNATHATKHPSITTPHFPILPAVAASTTSSTPSGRASALAVVDTAKSNPSAPRKKEDAVTIEAELQAAVKTATEAAIKASVAPNVQVMTHVPESIEPSVELTALAARLSKTEDGPTVVQQQTQDEPAVVESKDEESTPHLAEVYTAESPPNEEHGEDHDESNCPDECCAASRASIDDVKDVQNTIHTADPLGMTQDKCRSPESTDLSHSSSCSEEVAKNADVVRISSC